MSGETRLINPFPGLRPFHQDEDDLFFGREEQTLELLQRLSSQRFVAVVGTSGSGKSSLVRCGLLSELLGGKMLQAGASWEVAVTHPGGNPLVLLAEALLDAGLYDCEQDNARENLLATLSRSHFGLVEAVKQADIGRDTNFLLVVDQFEEIFRFHIAGQMQQEVASEFVSILLESVGQKDVPIYVVLTMRSDFIGECGQFEGLAEMVNRGEFLIPRLTREQYKRVIEGPIKVAGGRITPRLLQRLLNDLGQQADQLPCLQHALMRTWNVWSGSGDSGALDLDDYRLVGGMTQALSLHADEVYASLASDRQRELCQGISQALTVQESENRGIRRPQRLSALCQILEVPADELRPIIDAYRQHGVTFLMPSPEVELTEQTVIDISHESLMRVWIRLRRWVEEEAQAAGIYRRLSESATLYEHGKVGLYRDPELDIALAWRDSKRPNRAWAERYHPGFGEAMTFLDASHQTLLAEQQAQEQARQRELEQARKLAEAQRLRAESETRAARRLRGLAGGLALVAIVAVVASIVAFNSWLTAEQAKFQAEISERSARQNAKAAQAEAKRALNAEDAAEQSRMAAVAARDEAEIRAYTASLAASAADLNRNDSQTLKRRLEQAPEHLRGWEWAYLWNESDRSLETPIKLPPMNFGYHIDLSRDGRLAASRPAGGHDKPVTIYDTRTGQTVATLMTSSSSHPVMTFSSDKKLLAYSHWGTPGVQVYEIATGRLIVPEQIQRTFNSFLAFDPPGLRAAVVDENGKIRIFTTDDWTQAAELPATATVGNADQRRRGAISPDGRLLVAGGNGDDPTQVYDLQSNTVVKELSESSPVVVVQFDETSDSLTTVAADGRIIRYSAANWEKVAETREREQRRGDIAVHRSGSELETISFDSTGAVVVYSSRLARVSTLRGHGAGGTTIAVDHEAGEIVSAHRDGAVLRWDLHHPRDLPFGSADVVFGR